MSACHVLVAPEYDVRVLTVDNAPKPLAEQQRLYDFMGIEMDRLDLELEDVRCGDFKAHSADCNYESVYTYLRAKYGHLM